MQSTHPFRTSGMLNCNSGLRDETGNELWQKPPGFLTKTWHESKIYVTPLSVESALRPGNLELTQRLEIESLSFIATGVVNYGKYFYSPIRPVIGRSNGVSAPDVDIVRISGGDERL